MVGNEKRNHGCHWRFWPKKLLRMQLLLTEMGKGGEKFIYYYSIQIQTKSCVWQTLLASPISHFAFKGRTGFTFPGHYYFKSKLKKWDGMEGMIMELSTFIRQALFIPILQCGIHNKLHISFPNVRIHVRCACSVSSVVSDSLWSHGL